MIDSNRWANLRSMPASEVTYIVVHCADTPARMDVGAADIDRWHREKGWLGIGYHYVIRRSGEVEQGRPVTVPGAHVEGHNAWSLGICMVGGRAATGTAPEDNFTLPQKRALRRLLDQLVVDRPKAKIVGHRDLNSHKACPSFDVKQWWTQENA